MMDKYMIEDELYSFHEEVFKPLYADLIAVLGNKPDQVLFELEAVLSHIAVAKTTDDKTYQKNIEKAFGHLHRAALDTVKMLWLVHKERAEEILLDQDAIKLAINMNEHDYIKKYKEAENIVKKARDTESKNIGINQTLALELYYQAAQAFAELTDTIDPISIKHMRKLKSKVITKERIIAFGLGVASSALVSVLFAIIA